MKSVKYWTVYRKLVRVANRFFPVTLARMRFKKLFGRDFDIDNPKDLNEKILWLSLFSDTSTWSRCSDKYAVRDFVNERGLGDILVKLYGKWDNVKDIDWEKLPDRFVIKTNNGSGTVLLVEDKTKLNIKETELLLEKWLLKDITQETTEFHYRNITPCIIAEELLEMTEEDKQVSSSIIDYKIWCFNGKPDSFLICSNRNDNGCCLSVYDTNWNYHPEASVFDQFHTERESLLPKPKNLEYMLIIAQKLSSGFPEVRVDLYNVGGKIYFGELTFTSLGGTMTYYSPDELFRMGQLVDITRVKKARNV